VLIVHGLKMIGNSLNDLRYGAKMLWKSKGVTIVAVCRWRSVSAQTPRSSVSSTRFSCARACVESGTGGRTLRKRRREQPYQHFLSKLSRAARSQRSFHRPRCLQHPAVQALAATRSSRSWGEAVSGNYFDVLGVGAKRDAPFLPMKISSRAEIRSL
jgi:hypothetical protein